MKCVYFFMHKEFYLEKAAISAILVLYLFTFIFVHKWQTKYLLAWKSRLNVNEYPYPCFSNTLGIIIYCCGKDALCLQVKDILDPYYIYLQIKCQWISLSLFFTKILGIIIYSCVLDALCLQVKDILHPYYILFTD